MGTTNKAEEILKTKPFQLIGIDRFYGWNTTINAMEEYRQSEIYELTNQLKQNLIKDIDRAKELEEINISVTKLIKERDELTKEVERLKEIARYCEKCGNINDNI